MKDTVDESVLWRQFNNVYWIPESHTAANGINQKQTLIYENDILLIYIWNKISDTLELLHRILVDSGYMILVG